MFNKETKANFYNFGYLFEESLQMEQKSLKNLMKIGCAIGRLDIV